MLKRPHQALLHCKKDSNLPAACRAVRHVNNQSNKQFDKYQLSTFHRRQAGQQPGLYLATLFYKPRQVLVVDLDIDIANPKSASSKEATLIVNSVKKIHKVLALGLGMQMNPGSDKRKNQRKLLIDKMNEGKSTLRCLSQQNGRISHQQTTIYGKIFSKKTSSNCSQTSLIKLVPVSTWTEYLNLT